MRNNAEAVLEGTQDIDSSESQRNKCESNGLTDEQGEAGGVSEKELRHTGAFCAF